MSQFDDATQEACLFLLKNRKIWNREESYLRYRTFLALVRWYQNERKLRKRKRLIKVDQPVETFSLDARDSVAEREYVETAIERARLTDVRDVVWSWIDGVPIKELAQERKTTVYQITQIVEQFKHALNTLSDEPLEGEKEECPLLYPEKWSRRE